MHKNSLSAIQNFLNLKRIAIAGVSRKKADYSRMMAKEFVKRGYTVIPVNPKTDTIDGMPCFQSVSKIEPPPEGVIILTPKNQADAVIDESVKMGIKNIWLRDAKAVKLLRPETLQQLEAGKINFVAGECPFMFLKDTDAIHRFHGWLRKMFGKYPGK